MVSPVHEALDDSRERDGVARLDQLVGEPRHGRPEAADVGSHHGSPAGHGLVNYQALGFHAVTRHNQEIGGRHELGDVTASAEEDGVPSSCTDESR